MSNKQVGNFIKIKRKEKDLNQSQLSEMIGVSERTINKWESGQCIPEYFNLQLLSQALDISASEILDIKSETNYNDKSFKNKLKIISKKTYLNKLILYITCFISILTILIIIYFFNNNNLSKTFNIYSNNTLVGNLILTKKYYSINLQGFYNSIEKQNIMTYGFKYQISIESIGIQVNKDISFDRCNTYQNCQNLFNLYDEMNKINFNNSNYGDLDINLENKKVSIVISYLDERLQEQSINYSFYLKEK